MRVKHTVCHDQNIFACRSEDVIYWSMYQEGRSTCKRYHPIVLTALLLSGDCSLVRRFYSPKVRKSEIKGSSFRRFVSPKVRKSDNDIDSFLF